MICGFMNSWKWHEKSGHWDVTIKKGDKHINVNPDGTITHGKIPPEWEKYIK